MSEELKLVILGITDPSTLACISRARKFTQYNRMVGDALAVPPRCPFCHIDREYNKVVAETDYWYAWPCNPPEKNTRLHFLFVPKRHVLCTRYLTVIEIVNLFNIRLVVSTKYGYMSCGTMIRDGDATLSAGTIQHLHVHDMVPDGTGRVESPFFKGKGSEEEGVRRAIAFEKMRQVLTTEGVTDLQALTFSLTPEEMSLVRDRLE